MAGEAVPGGDRLVMPRGRVAGIVIVITACQPDMLVTSLHQTFYIPLVIIHSLHPLSRLAQAGWMPTWQKEMSYCISDLIYVSDSPLTVTFLLPGPAPDLALIILRN